MIRRPAQALAGADAKRDRFTPEIYAAARPSLPFDLELELGRDRARPRILRVLLDEQRPSMTQRPPQALTAATAGLSIRKLWDYTPQMPKNTAWAVRPSPETLLRHDKELRCYLRRKGRSTDEITTLVGRTWLAAVRTFQGRCSLRYYLYSVLRRQMADYYRKRGKRAPHEELGIEIQESIDDGVSLENLFLRNATMERVELALTEMPAHYAEVVGLVLKGYSNAAIAKRLGIEHNTVRSRLSRGKARLLELLRAYEEED